MSYNHHIDIVLLKLLVFPALMLSLAALAGFDKTGYAVLLCVFGTPIAVSSYVMAVREKADGELAGQLVVISSAVSAVTMFLLVYVSRLFGLL
jgi:predicted permease